MDIMVPGRLKAVGGSDSDIKIRQAPHNIEAEQALLGAILINNDAFHRCEEIEPKHFFDPLHQRIFEAIQRFSVIGRVITPVTLKPVFENEAPIGALTIPQYLGRLAASATSVINAADYAKTIYALWVRRELIVIGDDMANGAYEASLDVAPAEQIEEAESRLFMLGDMGAWSSHEASAAQAARAAMDMVAAAYRRDSGLSGLSTGFHGLDAFLGGLAPENLIILAGRPSMGKTALGASIAFNVAETLRRNGEKLADSAAGGPRIGEVSFYSLEMSAEQLMQRQIAQKSGIPADRQRRGTINEDEFVRLQDAADDLAGLPVHIDSTGALTISQLVSRARRRKRLFGTVLIVVDYLQLMATGRNRDNRTTEITEISMALKALAKELKIPVIALSQLSRNVENREDKRPQLSDLRESGAIEQDADVVMFVFREEYYVSRREPSASRVDEHNAWEIELELCRGIAEIPIAKHRHGSVGTVKMSFTGALTLFSDLESRLGR